MPLYDYRCTKCGTVTEVRHGFDEAFTGTCSIDGAPLQRVFNPAPIVFKGSGFYVTDSRPSGAKAGSSESKPAESKPAAESAPAQSAPAKPSTPSDSAA
jgi:putative FmdB family regulatory protein